MKKIYWFIISFIIAVSSGSVFSYEAIVGPTGVLKYVSERSYGGYTLFAPMMNSKTTYLIDMEGSLVHKWESEYTPGSYAMLLPNGNLLRGGVMEKRAAAIGVFEAAAFTSSGCSIFWARPAR